MRILWINRDKSSWICKKYRPRYYIFMQKLHGISGLRGIIALIIVLYHLQQVRPIQGLAEWNWDVYQYINMFPVVVAVFFILTGLLRSLGYWKYILTDTPKPDTYTTITERWWRIAPTYYIVLIASFLWGIYVSGISLGNVISLFSGFTFLNWISSSTFFPTEINGPLWFVGYDMMGYIFTIFMMLWLTQVYKKYIYRTIIAYLFLFLTLHFVWVSLPWSPGEGVLSVWFPHYSPFIFALYSLMGVIIGGIVTRFDSAKKSFIWDWVFIFSIVAIFGYLWMIRWAPDLAYSYPMSPYRFPLIPGLWALAIVSLIYSKYMGRLMDNRFFLWLASISYSLYLWHGLVMSMLITIVFQRISTSLIEWSIMSIATLGISCAIAVLSAKYIEWWKWRR